MAELTTLRVAYASPLASEVDLPSLAVLLGRTKSAVCQKAASLGLTDPKRLRMPVEERKVRVARFATVEARRQHQSGRMKEIIAERGHPRGMAGKHHSAETREHLSKTSAAMNAARTVEQLAAFTLKGMKTKAANGTLNPPRLGASWKAGWRVIGGIRKFYRSKWEANYARYLEWLKGRGEILAWAHEPKTFWFEGVRRGAVSYLPDFCITEKSGRDVYHEVKGWMDDRSATKIKRMAKYHPRVKLIVIRKKQYSAIARKVSALVPGWE